MSPAMEKQPVKDPIGPGLSVVAKASSQHPCDWGRALASAVSQLVEEIIETTGIDPCCEPLGLDLSLHISDLPGGKTITAMWVPDPPTTEVSSSSSNT